MGSGSSLPAPALLSPPGSARELEDINLEETGEVKQIPCLAARFSTSTFKFGQGPKTAGTDAKITSTLHLSRHLKGSS